MNYFPHIFKYVYSSAIIMMCSIYRSSVQLHLLAENLNDLIQINASGALKGQEGDTEDLILHT